LFECGTPRRCTSKPFLVLGKAAHHKGSPTATAWLTEDSQKLDDRRKVAVLRTDASAELTVSFGRRITEYRGFRGPGPRPAYLCGRCRSLGMATPGGLKDSKITFVPGVGKE
jgi:hypothetical protein